MSITSEFQEADNVLNRQWLLFIDDKLKSIEKRNC